MKMVVAKECECLRCDFVWKSKLERPKYCPRCKQAKWDILPRVKKSLGRLSVKTTQDEIFDAIGNAARTRQDALKGIMRETGLTLEAFAGKIGTTPEKLAPYLDGERPVTEEQLAHVRRVAGAV